MAAVTAAGKRTWFWHLWAGLFSVRELRSDVPPVFMPAYIKPPDIFDAVLAAQGHLFGRQRGPQELDKAPARYIQPYVKTNKKRANSAFCAQLGTMPPSPRAPAVDVGPVRRD